MGENSWVDMEIIDGHVHYGHPSLKDNLMQLFDDFKVNRLNVVCTPHMERLSLTPDALHLKAHFPERIYVFGGLDISVFFRAPQQAGELLAQHVDTLMAMGCDGVKMIEGKPTMRRMLPIQGFDAGVLEPYWAYMESQQIPLLFHVNDPEEFWDKENLPDWAREAGWDYSGEGFVNNEVQYSEILNVMDRHPNLKVIFAHFFFLSAQLPRLAEYLEKYPNMYIDLTPGIEMYRNFSNDPQVTRDFFMKYQDRIIYGTDIGANTVVREDDIRVDKIDSNARVQVVRNFLECEGSFKLDAETAFLFGKGDQVYEGIHLAPVVLEKIYRTNFEKVAGRKPGPLNRAVILQALSQIEQAIQIQGSARPGEPGDVSVVRDIKAFFGQSEGE